MKKRLVTAILLITALILLSSCNLFVQDKKPGGDGEKSDSIIYGEGYTTNIIIGSGTSYDLSEIESAIFKAAGVVVGLRNDSSPAAQGEIVIGDTTRQITAAAKAELNKAIRSEIIGSSDEDFAEKDTLGYGVYAKDGAIAVVWKGELAKDMAFDLLVKEYLGDASLDSDPVISNIKVFSETEYYEELTARQKEESWAALKEGFIDFGCSEQEAENCVKAVQNFYSIADERVYLWVANLYDPALGGFYYSNSGRDTEGFLPDIESTLQAINLLQNNGMFDDFGDTAKERLQNALPEEMQKKIAEFVSSRQSNVDGYFHHPQWEGMDSSWTSRLNRDLNWAIQLLEWFDTDPLYSLPTVRPVSAEPLTGKLTSSSVKAVSKVILADSANMEFLESPEKFRAYLESFDWESQSYQAANIISSFTIQLHARGQEYIDVYDNFLRERQNPENGLWEAGIYYASTNGLMKVVAAFNSLGIELQYPDKAFESAIIMAKHTGADEEGFPANHIVDVYNPWYVMSDILTNVEEHGNHEMAQKLRATLVSEAEELIRKSMEKTSPFRKDDGSFGYNWDFSPSTSQGAPVSVPGTVEGDVNGCVMSFGVLGNLLSTFGIEKPRRYFMTDYLMFINELENLGEVVKSNIGTPAEVITFDDEPLGNTEPYAFSSVSISSGIGQTELREGSDEDVVYHITDTSTKTGTSIRFTPGGVPVGASRCVAEFEINVKSSTDGVIYQVFMGSTYQLTLTSKDGYIRLGDSSTKGVVNDFGVTFKKGEWHTVRVEYYFTGAESTTVTKIFLDGDLRALSNNFYGKLPEPGAKPDLAFHEVHLYSLFDPTVDTYFDNLYACKDNELYKEEPIVNPYRVENFENVENDKKSNGMSTNLYNSDAVFEILDNPYTDENSSANGKVLHFAAPAGAADFSKRIESLVSTGNTYVFEADVYISNITMNEAVTQTYFRSSDGSIFSLTLQGGSDAGGKYADICTLDPKTNKAKDTLARVYLGEWTKLRIEFYRYQYEVSEDGNLWAGVKVRVIIDGEERFNDICSYPDPNTLSKEAVSFFNYVLSGKTLDMYLDNLIFETANITYVDKDGNPVPDPENPAFPRGGDASDTPAAADHNGKFDFESAKEGIPSVGGLVTTPNASEYGNSIEVAKDEDGNKALKFVTVPSDKSGNSAEFAASKLSSAKAKCQVFEFEILAEKASGDENYIQLYMYDKNEKLISSYNILFPKNLSGSMEIGTRLSSSVSESSTKVSIPFASGYIKFRFEYYENNGMSKVYVNDTLVLEGFGAYNGVGSAGALASVRMNALIRSQFELYVDNVAAESIEKNYRKEL